MAIQEIVDVRANKILRNGNYAKYSRCSHICIIGMIMPFAVGYILLFIYAIISPCNSEFIPLSNDILIPCFLPIVITAILTIHHIVIIALSLKNIMTIQDYRRSEFSEMMILTEPELLN
jgi:hypothetical protein